MSRFADVLGDARGNFLEPTPISKAWQKARSVVQSQRAKGRGAYKGSISHGKVTHIGKKRKNYLLL